MQKYDLFILGVPWKLYEKSVNEDERLNECDGYCDWTSKTIVVENEEEGTLDNMNEYVKKVKRHEIVHAFLFESGLAECAFTNKESWAHNEEMVDWFARQGLKIYEAWDVVEAI